MFSQVTPGNKDLIMGLMRSVGVCLNIILTDDLVESMSRHTSQYRVVIDSKQAVIDNIMELLTHERHLEFIDNLISNLSPDQARLFRERLELARSLATSNRMVSRKLLETLENCELDFISQLWPLFTTENEATRSNCAELLNKLRDNDLSTDILNDMCMGTGGYAAPYVGAYAGSYSDHPYSHAYMGQGYAYLWGSYIYGLESPEELEVVSRRLRLQQIFTSGMRNHEMIIWKFKDKTTRFTLEETDAILADAENCQGVDEDEKIFRATAHMTVRSHATFAKLTRS